MVVDHACSKSPETESVLRKTNKEPLEGSALHVFPKDGIEVYLEQWRDKYDKKVLTADEKTSDILIFFTRGKKTCNSFLLLDQAIGQLLIFSKDNQKAIDYFACGADCEWIKDPMAILADTRAIG